MNASPIPPVAPTGLVVGLVYRFVAFIAVCIRPSGLGTTRAATLQTGAPVVAFAARLLASTRGCARLAAHTLRQCGRRRTSSGASRVTPPSGHEFGRMAAFVSDAFPAVTARDRRATLNNASSQATGSVLWRARGFGVVLPAACFPSADTPTGEAQFTAVESAYNSASGASAQARCDRAPRTVSALVEQGSDLRQPASPRRVPSSVSPPRWVALSIATDSERQRRQARPAPVAKAGAKPRKRTQTWSCPRAATGARRAPVANFRQAFATGVRAPRSR